MTFKKVFGLLLILIILAAGGIYLLMIEKADDDRMRSLYTEVAAYIPRSNRSSVSARP